MNIKYPELFRGVRDYLILHAPVSTDQITTAIKQYFHEKYSSPTHTVLCSRADQREFVLDVLVTNFHPRHAIQREMRQPSINSARIHLAVESELGGTGGSSPRGVMNNVIEDYFKLIFVTADYRILFFTSLPYANEPDHIVRRADTLRQLYAAGPMNSQGICLIHLLGAGPGQVRVTISRGNIRGFIVSANGSTCTEILAED